MNFYADFDYQIQQAGKLLAAIDRFGYGSHRTLVERIFAECSNEKDLLNSTVAVLSQDFDGILNFYNRGARNIFGYRSSEIITRPTQDLVPEGEIDVRAEMFTISIEQNCVVYTGPLKRRRKGGSIVQIEGYIVPYLLGGVPCISAVLEKMPDSN